MEQKDRLMSLDALRGADMLCIMGGSAVVVALCQLLGFGSPHWEALVLSLGQVLVAWIVLWYFYRKNTFLRV